MFRLIILLIILLVIFLPSIRAETKTKFKLSRISYKNNSRLWHNRNDHLIPTKLETEAILSLNQERDYTSDDIDRDGVVNSIDPSIYDWREIGYQPFGVCAFLPWRHSWNNYKYSRNDLKKTVVLLQDAGIAFVRMIFLWQDIEPLNDNYIFDKYDFIVNLLCKQNIHILAVLGYSASGAAEASNNPPRNLEDFLDYVSKVISRYKDKIKYWEVWNEPDNTLYWQPQDNMKTYTDLLKKIYLLAKKIDPSCRIVLGGMSSSGYRAIKNVYKNGGKDYFDIINIHPFIDPLQGKGLKKIYEIYTKLERLKVQYKDKDKKIWFSAIGCPGIKENVAGKGWRLSKHSPTEKQQAQFLYSVFTDLIELPNLEKIFWFYFRDNKEYFENDEDYSGLVRWDFSPKAAFDWYKDRYLRWLNLSDYFKARKKYAK